MLSASEALERLTEGNARFAAGGMRDRTPELQELRADLADGQQPWAVILACSDSRVVPEIVFDQSLGDLFVIRLAGNVVSEEAMGSIEYAVGELGVRLVVVLGHSACGVAKAALAVREAADPSPLTPGLESLVSEMADALDSAIESGAQGEDAIELAIRRNVMNGVAELSTSPILGPLSREGELSITGALYGLDSGSVELPLEAG